MQASLCEKVHIRGQRFRAETHLSEEEPGAELSPTLVSHSVTSPTGTHLITGLAQA